MNKEIKLHHGHQTPYCASGSKSGLKSSLKSIFSLMLKIMLVYIVMSAFKSVSNIQFSQPEMLTTIAGTCLILFVISGIKPFLIDLATAPLGGKE
jgi:hypothetical protein